MCSTAAPKKLIYGLDPSKYPSRMGQPWKKDEVAKLLTQNPQVQAQKQFMFMVIGGIMKMVTRPTFSRRHVA